MMKEYAAICIIDNATGIFLSGQSFYLALTTISQVDNHCQLVILYINKQFHRGCHFPKVTYWQKAKFGFALRSYSKNNVFSLTEFYIDTKLENVVGASKHDVE